MEVSEQALENISRSASSTYADIRIPLVYPTPLFTPLFIRAVLVVAFFFSSLPFSVDSFIRLSAFDLSSWPVAAA